MQTLAFGLTVIDKQLIIQMCRSLSWRGFEAVFNREDALKDFNKPHLVLCLKTINVSEIVLLSLW